MGLRTWDDGAVRRALGNVGVGPTLVAAFGDGPEVPESDLEPFDLVAEAKASGRPYPEMLDQGRYGACNGHAAATSLEWARYVAGDAPIALSPWYVYAILCNGIDRGSNISQALRLLSERGTCRNSLVPHGTISPRRLPAEAQAEASRWRVEAGGNLSSWRGLLSAAARRQPFNFSVAAGGRFNDLDAEGCIRGAGWSNNHAVTGGLGLKPTKRGWAILMQNSWSAQWGDRGYAWVVEDMMRFNGSFDAYPIAAVESDRLEADAPPPLPAFV